MVGVPILLNLIKLEFLSSCLLVNRLVGARARVLDAWSGRASFVKIFVFFRYEGCSGDGCDGDEE